MPHPFGLSTSADVAAANTAASIADNTLALHASDVDARGRFPIEAIAALRAAGLLGLCVGEDSGGAGASPRGFAAVVEALAQSCASTAMVFVMHVSAQQAIAASTTLSTRAQLLRQIAAGNHLTTLALSEKGSRSQFWAPVSRLTESSAGLSSTAQKSWVTAANHADSYVCSSQRPGGVSPLESTLYLVRRGAGGVRVGGAWNGLGLRGNDAAPVFLEGAHVATADLVTKSGEGAAAMLQVILPWFSVGTAAMATGICRAAVAATAAHMSHAGFEHTGEKLRDLPTLRARLAEMAVRTEQARALLGRTLGEIEHPSPETPLFVLLSRLASIEAAVAVTDLAMKACGGAAFSGHLPLERLFRDARAGWVMAPTVDHLDDFVGKALTGLPLF
ncbi:MAG TPA: acyl-CoA dehydrogenase family protein [Polyangia bacterium]